HFTRVETLLLPYHLNKITNLPVWSLADYSLFKSYLGRFLDKIGAISTKNPDRDLLIVRSLLTGEAAWIIFPEGLMVKSKKIVEKGRFMVSFAGGKRPPHTGAATLALRTEFYRKRLLKLSKEFPEEARRLIELFKIDTIESLADINTYIVPVNVTYYPIRAEENILSHLATNLVETIPERVIEEIMTEGRMLLTGVDADIRFGKPIVVSNFLNKIAIEKDVSARRKINFDDPIPSKRIMRKVALDLMHRYILDIYKMTTLNYDHLFASMLKQIPVSRINEASLRRKVYLAVDFIKRKNVPMHKHFSADQTSLLIDDNFDLYRDFINLAVEKGIVKKNGDRLEKDRSKFSSVFPFHRVRIDNPIAVIANEVEPLADLQRRFRRIAWQSDVWVRIKIIGRLLKSAEREFETDYNTFYIEGESKETDVGRPFLIKGRSRGLGVLLVHGYMAAPLEVKELARYLGRRGIWVYAPRLKGHGTSPEDLSLRTYLDWLKSVDNGYAIISNVCKRLVVGGFSTGAGLSLHLATRMREVRGVFAVSPPLRLQDLSSKFVPAVDVWNRIMSRFKLDGAKKEFVNNHPENPHINYLRNPISGVLEIERLMESLEPKLSEIEIPALVAQSQGDPVVDPGGSKRIFERLGSEDKTYLLFNFNRHGILLGEGAERVYQAIWHFIRRLR
ncbi:MAG: alpha/beta hydrolase, partial [Desulfobacterales bacterium]